MGLILPFYLFCWDPWEEIFISPKKGQLIKLGPSFHYIKVTLDTYCVFPQVGYSSAVMSGMLAISSPANGKVLFIGQDG